MTKFIGEQFEIIRFLDKGGQGEVFLVKSTLDNKQYALKVIKNHTVKAIKRFKLEIKTLKSIDSQYVVKITSENISDDDSEEKELYYVMELAKYGTLKDNNYYINDLELCLKLFKYVCLGVKSIHDKGLLHRDLKPSNILLLNHQRDIKISDFGLSYELNENNEKITEIREKVGAIYFSAPEVTSLPPNPTKKSDIFSLGKILYFMITGKYSKNLEESLSIKDFVQHRLADKTNDLINRMCTYEPKNRIDSVDEIIEIIDDLLGNKISETKLTLTVLQYRIFKFIRSFDYNSTNFEDILNYIFLFYDIDSSSGLFPRIMFSSKTPRSEFTEKVEKSLEVLEKNNIINFKNGKYNYIKNESNELLFKENK